MMSRVPMGSNAASILAKLLERWEIVLQGISAEVIAEEWGLSREELDAYSYESHRRAVAAIDEGRFEKRDRPDRGLTNPHVGVAFDTSTSAVRRDTSLEKLASLQPAFVPDGKVTAGNSSADLRRRGGVLVASEAAASRLGLEPRARFVSFGLAGVDPTAMLHGNPQACEKALAKAGTRLGRRRGDRGERGVRVGRAPVPAGRRASRSAGRRDVNPNGGGISLGHPLGATGARMTATLAQRARAPRRAVRRRRDVHRLRPGDRRRRRARLGRVQHWLLVRGRGERRLDAEVAARRDAGALVDAAAPRAGRRPGAPLRRRVAGGVRRGRGRLRAGRGPGAHALALALRRSGRSSRSTTCDEAPPVRRPA